MGAEMILFDDQAELVAQTRAAMSRSKSVLMVSPTGSGKTAMATHIIESAKEKGRRILFSVPRRDLMEQTSETFERLGIKHGFVAAGNRITHTIRFILAWWIVWLGAWINCRPLT